MGSSQRSLVLVSDDVVAFWLPLSTVGDCVSLDLVESTFFDIADQRASQLTCPTRTFNI